jgi:hypothetical protein
MSKELPDKLHIQELTDELEPAAILMSTTVLGLIEGFEDESINLSSRLTGPTLGRAMYHIGLIVGFADGRDQTVAELFDELGLP